MDGPRFARSLVSGHSGGVRRVAVVSHAAVKLRAQVPVCASVFRSREAHASENVLRHVVIPGLTPGERAKLSPGLKMTVT